MIAPEQRHKRLIQQHKRRQIELLQARIRKGGLRQRLARLLVDAQQLIGGGTMLSVAEVTFEAFGEPRVRWPGQLHTAARHPFRALLIDSRVVPDLYGC